MPTSEAELTVKLHRVQEAFCQSDAPYRGFVGGRGAGKSWVGAFDLLCRAQPGRTYMVVGPTYPQLRDSSLRSFLMLARDFGVIDANHLKLSPPPQMLTTHGVEILFRSADDPERLRGPNLSGVWLDEASLMSRDAFDIIIAALREHGEQGWLSATFTPKGVNHWTYDLFGKARPDTALFHARTADNPFNPAGFADTIGRHYESNFARQELAGEFVDADDGWQVIPTAWVRAAQDRWTPNPPEGFPLTCLGVDVARGGGDKFVISSRYGPWFAPLVKHPGASITNGPLAAARIVAAHDGKATINIDILNVGYSPYDILRESLGALVNGVNNSNKSEAKDKSGKYGFVNVRAASYWSLREALDPVSGQGLMLPPDAELLADLTAPRFSVQANGIKIEPKPEIIERIKRSPDAGDAVVLAWWQVKKKTLQAW